MIYAELADALDGMGNVARRVGASQIEAELTKLSQQLRTQTRKSKPLQESAWSAPMRLPAGGGQPFMTSRLNQR